MPLWNWIQCTNGNLSACRRTEAGDPKTDNKVWDEIYDSYIRDMGLDKLYKRILDTMRKKAQLECDFILTNDKFKLTLIAIENTKLEEMIAMSERGDGQTIEKSLVYMSKWVGSWLNAKEITVKEYFVMLREMENMNKNIKGYGKEN